MSKLLKNFIREELESRFESVDGGVFLSTQGLNSEKTYAFRTALHAKNVKFTVIRNAMARQAFARHGYRETDLKKVLQGPVGVAYTTNENSAADAAKVVAAWKREARDQLVQVKGAFVEGQILDAKDAEALKNAPTKDEARAQLLGIIQAPATRFLATIREPVARIVYLLNAYKEKREEQAG